MTTLRCAAVQMTSGADLDANLSQAEALVRDAAAGGATYIQLPEYAAFWGPVSKYRDGAQHLSGPFVTAMTDLARALEVVVHVGSFLEIGDHGRYRNTSVVIGPSGHVATYTKMHLFDVDVPDAVTFHESHLIDAGTAMVTADTGEAVVGLSICFDVRFPELYRALALAGAQVLGVPAAFSAATGPAHWELLLRARAVENGAFVVAAAQSGVTREGLATHGHAMIVNPWGEVLAEVTSPGPGLAIADCVLDQVHQRRTQINTLGLRRGALYHGVVARTSVQG